MHRLSTRYQITKINNKMHFSRRNFRFFLSEIFIPIIKSTLLSIFINCANFEINIQKTGKQFLHLHIYIYISIEILFDYILYNHPRRFERFQEIADEQTQCVGNALSKESLQFTVSNNTVPPSASILMEG